MNMARTIQITQGKSVLVDNEDFEFLSKYKWHYLKSGNEVAVTHLNKKKKVYMHRLLLNPPKNKLVDHINGNGLDNRRFNLRICTQKENVRNHKIFSTNTSGYTGVHWAKDKKKWQSRIRVNYKRISLGYFKNIIKAAQAYNEAAKEYFGEFARLNKIGVGNG